MLSFLFALQLPTSNRADYLRFRLLTNNHAVLVAASDAHYVSAAYFISQRLFYELQLRGLRGAALARGSSCCYVLPLLK